MYFIVRGAYESVGFDIIVEVNVARISKVIEVTYPPNIRHLLDGPEITKAWFLGGVGY